MSLGVCVSSMRTVCHAYRPTLHVTALLFVLFVYLQSFFQNKYAVNKLPTSHIIAGLLNK